MAKERREALFRDIDNDVQGAVVYLMAGYPKLVDTSTDQSGGNPFAIALDLAGQPMPIVVTQEKGGSATAKSLVVLHDDESNVPTYSGCSNGNIDACK